MRFAGMGCGCDMIFGDDKRTGMKCMMRGVDENDRIAVPVSLYY